MTAGRCLLFRGEQCRTHNLLQVPIAELAERWTELPQVLGSRCESRSFFRVHTGYFSNIPKCIKAEFIASWGCSQSSVVSSSQKCIRYKATNQKPAGLLQTPVPAQRFESIAIDLFGPLPETTEGMKWIFIVEDYTTKWVELFPLKQATAKECAMTLLNEVFVRYGVPRRLISDNGTQFVSAVMQQLCFVLDINHSRSLIPIYHPQANLVERKNRDLKPRLAMMVGNNHTLWIEKLPAIRFALNTSKCESTDHTAAYLTFARELRTLDQVNTDLRSVIHNDNFVPEFTLYLKRFEGYMSQIKENIEMSQDRQKTYADKSRRPSPNYKVNDLVWVKLHPLSKASQNRSAKLMPRRDGPYIVLSQRSPTTFVVASCDKPDEPL
ncbi:hypothetical protein TNCV_2279631 [Trichonephila clavipes]|uniref:Integrase catalytic domain-containing protein n=1 Tax=Trichonephila clavipes TaxID=2585209 RepID=A0A8X6R6L6_TRICX|nr:hypothetical protein TNCV_2279631 [Trichonephila clavipes]